MLLLKSMGVSTAMDDFFLNRRRSFLRTSAREKRKLTKKIFTDKKFGCGWRHLFQRVPTPGWLAQSTPHLTYMLCIPGLPLWPTKLHGFPMLSNSRKYLRSLCRETMFLPITQLCCDKFNWSGPKAPLWVLKLSSLLGWNNVYFSWLLTNRRPTGKLLMTLLWKGRLCLSKLWCENCRSTNLFLLI